ncbi:hypothetical protein [Microbacterium lacticum]|uniref:hypothetical protein n=1 Tax=Microbacterium lacticum TaxID=33885 RepID=UPI0018B044F5|nr:hypothetical protein [Microbacterium lacticum]
MSDGEAEERLTQAMLMLDEGLRRIARKYEGAVSLVEEDPETFGAGHYVFYPEAHSRTRFAIEEQYAPGVGWDDPDRVPTSWLWRAERRTRHPDGTHVWAEVQFGESFPEQLPELLTTVERWVRRTKNLADQEQAFGGPDRRGPAPAPGAPPTSPSGRAASSGKETRTPRSRSSDSSPNGPSTRICGRASSGRPPSSRS